jgi:TPP-dependent pyruvate/acetoin dehydrogenase alpha subunit
VTDRELYLRMYRTMAVQRAVAHDAGHEAVSVGTAAALRPDDLICSPHRDPGADLWRGGGTVHSGRWERNVYHPPGQVADTWPVAAGSAFAARFGGGNRVVLAYDTQTRGGLREAVDIAAALDLPCLFVVPPGTAAASGVAREDVDGVDVIAVYEATRRAAGRARAGEGPTLIGALSAGSVRRDPVEEFAGKLTDLGVATAGELDRIRFDARRQAPAVRDTG